MSIFWDSLLFILLSYIGGRIGLRLKLPAGALLGAMLFVGGFKILGTVELNDVSPLLRIATQIALGTMIGLHFKKDILNLPIKRLAAFLIVGIGSILTALLVNIVFHYFGITTFITGLIAVAPGGLAEMITLSDSVQSDTQIVVIVHLIRFLIIMLSFKSLLKWSVSKKQGLEL
ncbi:AbrB family transcriptional regulator [Sporosarcina koreensis]|uniref:AbrB family transcriptional regulator n=1 Tax=Bacillales TaxID=1385 RepID=UPI000759DCEF|nr:AbrB family transcriptional regulator [Sporosarcina koreensis]